MMLLGFTWLRGRIKMKQYTLPYVKSTASGNLLYDSGSSDPVLSNNPEGCDGVVGERFRGRGHMYTYG